jgi:hypothetical protein
MTLPSLSHASPPKDLPASTAAPAPSPTRPSPSWVRTLFAGLVGRRREVAAFDDYYEGYPAAALRRGAPRRPRPALSRRRPDHD